MIILNFLFCQIFLKYVKIIIRRRNKKIKFKTQRLGKLILLGLFFGNKKKKNQRNRRSLFGVYKKKYKYFFIPPHPRNVRKSSLKINSVSWFILLLGAGGEGRGPNQDGVQRHLRDLPVPRDWGRQEECGGRNVNGQFKYYFVYIIIKDLKKSLIMMFKPNLFKNKSYFMDLKQKNTTYYMPFNSYN